jgi:DNA-binding CsgD family transcriptional regulator
LLHALDQYWLASQRYSEARAVVARTLASFEAGSPAWATALEAVAQLYLLSGEVGWLEHARRALASSEMDTDARPFLEAAVASAAPIAAGGVLPFPALERATARGRATGNRKLEIRATVHLATISVHIGDLRRGNPLLAWLDQHLESTAWPRAVVAAMQALATALSGDLALARSRALRALERGDQAISAALVGRIGFWVGEAALIERALREIDRMGPPGSVVTSFGDEVRGLAALLNGDFAGAAACFERCWILSIGMGMQRLALAEVALAQGDLPSARGHLAEMAQRFIEVDAQERARPAFGVRADVVHARTVRALGEPARGEAAAHGALATASASGLAIDTTDALEALALFLAERGERVLAARLLGAAEAFRSRSGYRWRAWDLRAPLEALRAQLDPTSLAEGAALSLEEAAALAQRGRGARGRPDHGWDALTPSERRVVELVAAGHSNQEIARKLFVSLATVKSHLVHVFQKLDVRSRAELAVIATRRAEAS